MSKDWNGNSKSIYVTLGASNHVEEEREQHDFYATDPFALECLIDEANVKFTNTVLEPCAGNGHLSEVLKSRGYNVINKDLIQREYPLDGTWNFLKIKEKFDCDIVMNPPYSDALEFVEKALDVIEDGNNVYAFLKIQFLEGKKRRDFFDKKYLEQVYVFTGRVKCAKNGDFESIGSSAVCYAWFKFNKLNNNPPIITWIN